LKYIKVSMLKITLSFMWRKLKEEIRLKHPPYPPSKEVGISLTIPLGEGGLKGLFPKGRMKKKYGLRITSHVPLGHPFQRRGNFSSSPPW